MVKFSHIIVTLLVLAIIGCLIYISKADLSSQEAALVSIILTLLSIVATYITSQYFAEKGHKEALEEVKQQHIDNLKTYAFNAAEKVDNLSKELLRLTVFLEDELSKEYDDELQTLHSRTDKIISTIHIIETLKSVNDTYLSDWRGVIPEELEEKNEEQLEREAELKDLIERVEELSFIGTKGIGSDRAHLKNEIDELRKQIIDVSRKIDGVRVRPKRAYTKPLKESINVNCNSCGHSISYKQRPMKNSFKPITCQSCGEKYTARWYPERGFELEPNIQREENIICPICDHAFLIRMQSIIYSSQQEICPNCNGIINVTRNIHGIKTKNMSGSRLAKKPIGIINEEVIQNIQKALPAQPWPKGIHIRVAEQLGLTKSQVASAIGVLIKRGIFNPQIDGTLYYRKEQDL